MIMNKLFFAIVLIVTLALNTPVLAQSQISTLAMDALCFRRDTGNIVDVIALIPYQMLQFDKRGSRYVADYSLTIKIKDINSKTIKDFQETRKITLMSYEETQGSKAGFEHREQRFPMQKGNFTVEVIVIDNKANTTFSKTRKITSIDFDAYPFALSSILLVSSIEQDKSTFKITPFLSDNISVLEEGVFIFFETYCREKIDSVDYQIRIINAKNEMVYMGDRMTKSVKSNQGTARHYLHFSPPPKFQAGVYTLRLYAFNKEMPTETAPIPVEPKEFLAMTERSISIERTFSTAINEDIDKAIRQLRYVASQSQIDEIQNGITTDDKKMLFEKFWKSLDPTPSTSLNEAFQDYYARVSYANEKFRSVGEGWMTDKGMIYIIFGQPDFIDRQPRRADGRSAERWTYNNTNRSFTFVDNSGFDDFRLTQPISPSEKYVYRK